VHPEVYVHLQFQTTESGTASGRAPPAPARQDVGGPDISGNIVVICPNHHRIIHATNAYFDRRSLTYEYPNGLREPLISPDHFVNAPQLSTP
jgi:hypothetical protein